MNPIAIIQARTGSKRLPGKVISRLSDHNVLTYVVKRCQQSKLLKNIIVATSNKGRDDCIEDLSQKIGVKLYRGSEEDVLKRFAEAAKLFKANPVIRICADSPLIDPVIIDETIDIFINNTFDYVCNNNYPRGMSAEVFTNKALQYAYMNTSERENHYREHVTTYFVDSPNLFHLFFKEPPEYYKRKEDIRLCVDEQEDLDLARIIYKHFYPREDFTLKEIISFLDQNPNIKSMNSHYK